MNITIKNLAVLIEEQCVKHGLHIALTGGQLYKDGPRKDVDFVVYHENSEHVNELTPEQREEKVEELYMSLVMEGFSNFCNYGRVTKCTYEGIDIDILYPEYTRLGEYTRERLNDPARVGFRFPITEDRS